MIKPSYWSALAVLATLTMMASPTLAASVAILPDAQYTYSLRIDDGTAVGEYKRRKDNASTINGEFFTDRLPVAGNPSDVTTAIFSARPYIALRTDQTAYGVGKYQNLIPHAESEIETQL